MGRDDAVNGETTRKQIYPLCIREHIFTILVSVNPLQFAHICRKYRKHRLLFFWSEETSADQLHRDAISLEMHLVSEYVHFLPKMRTQLLQARHWDLQSALQ